MVQIRNVPQGMHRELKARAARAGMTLSQYLLQEIATILQRPPLDEVLARIRSKSPVELSESPADAVRAVREGRE